MRNPKFTPRRGFRPNRTRADGRLVEGRPAAVNALEPRLLLSSAVSHATKSLPPALKSVGLSFPITSVHSPVHRTSKDRSSGDSVGIQSSLTGASTPDGGLTPQQIRAAYGVSSLNFNGIAGDGTGETIAILDPGDDAGMVNSTSASFATSDLAIFDRTFGLPNPPSFIKEGFTDPSFGTPALTTTLPAASSSDLETSLDVEWAHVMAPGANILLVEGNSAFTDIFNGVLAIDAVASSMHIVAVSMSFSGAESADIDSASDAQSVDASYFDTAGLVYVASTGDEGAFAQGTTTLSPQFPASSSNVLAVGGTTLNVSGNSYVSESTWGNGGASGSSGGGGGGISLYEPLPAYQVGKVNGLSTSNRTYPDISLDANPSTGVPVYDSPDDGSGTGWYPGTVGGTSLSAPLMAGLVADADQGRALAGFTALASSGASGVSASNPNGNPAASDIHTLLYGLGYGNSDFHDVTTGSGIGSTAAYLPMGGYDLATGLGSPVASDLVPDLAGVYSTAAVKVSPINNLYLKQTSTTLLGVWLNSATPGSGTPTVSYRLAYIRGINDLGGGGNDTLTLDFSNGNFAASFASEPLTVTALNPTTLGPLITFVGAGSNNTLVIVGTTGNDSVTATATTVTLGQGLGTTTIGLSNVQALQFAGGSGGSDTMIINGSPTGGYTVNASTASGNPNVTLTASNAGTLVLLATSQRIAGLVLQAGTVVQMTSLGAARTHANHNVLVIGSLNATSDPVFSIATTAKLDLSDNDMIVHTGSSDLGGQTELGIVQAAAAEGRNVAPGDGFDGTWNGNGLTSSAAAAADSGGVELDVLAVEDNSDRLVLGALSTWAAGSVAEKLGLNDILVKYTYNGDAALNGYVGDNSAGVVDAFFTTLNVIKLDDFAFGDFDGNNTVNDQDAGIVAALYGLGTGGENGPQL